MKTKGFYVLICLIGILCFSSCSEEDEVVYSCDDAVNLWVKDNLIEIRKMDRPQWKTLSASKKRAAYVAFTPQQKIIFWKEKLTDVMALDWTKDELEHIKLVYDFIDEHQDYFTDKGLSDEQLNVLDLFFYKWVEFARNELGWNMETIVSIAASGNDVIPENIKSSRVIKDFSDENISYIDDCHCSTKGDFCNVTGQGICEDSKCATSDFGCGWIWLQDCNGKCSDVYL